MWNTAVVWLVVAVLGPTVAYWIDPAAAVLRTQTEAQLHNYENF